MSKHKGPSPFWVILIILLVILAIVFGYRAWKEHRVSKAGYTGGDPDSYYAGDQHDQDDVVEGGRGPLRLFTREPWFEYATKGKKTVWGRLRTGPFGEDARTPLKVGDPVTVARSRPKGDETEYPGVRRYNTKVHHLKEYPTFKAMLKGEGLAQVFPGAKTEAAALKVYSEFYDEAAQQGSSVLAVGVDPPSADALAPKK